MSSVTQLEETIVELTNDSQLKILTNYIFKVLPQVNKTLKYWQEQATRIEDEMLRTQALSSLALKDFHCQGGSVYAVNNYSQSNLLNLIVAYQTICDYLDNLCDRAGVTEAKAFITLHQALIDALTPSGNIKNYYSDYMYSNDNGYLYELVSCCQKSIQNLPSYDIVHDEVIKLANLYIDLQVKKHLDWSQREQFLIDWATTKSENYPSIKWQEFAAASGSTLAIFALFNLATKPVLEFSNVKATVNAYFPWICGLHILLDYFIDQEEDLKGGDLNFTFYYQDNTEMVDRLKIFGRNALTYAGDLPNETFHKVVVQGLLAMYLSDAKVKRNRKHQISVDLIKDMGQGTINIYRTCKVVRTFV